MITRGAGTAKQKEELATVLKQKAAAERWTLSAAIQTIQGLQATLVTCKTSKQGKYAS
jgi:hypothetical protein